MPSVSQFAERMRYWCEDANLGYDQSNRWDIRPGGECDCSSLVIFALRECGFDTGSASYTGNLSVNLTARGWKRLSPSIAQAKTGDVLLNDSSHVAVVVSGSGWGARVAQASIDERGKIAGGQSGDQTGRETNTCVIYSYPWDCILRYEGADAGQSEQPGKPLYNAMVGGQWLPDMLGRYDTGGSADTYAGVFGKPVQYIAIEGVKYRVYTSDGGWLEYVSRRDLGDLVNGAAGDGSTMKRLEITDPGVRYRVHTLNGDWLPYMEGTHDTGGSKDTYAGNGRTIDAVEAYRVG